MYTYTQEVTSNRITRIVVYLDGSRVKVIRNSIPAKALEQKDYYIRMMTGMNGYTQWLNKG